jgi:hypothetical protein
MEDMVRDMEERYVTDLRRDCSVQVVVAGSSRIGSGLWKWCCEVQERERGWAGWSYIPFLEGAVNCAIVGVEKQQ